MSDYSPDRWQVVSLVNEEGERIDKVFGSWYGGYAGSDSWKLSSGITKVVEHDKHYEVHNVSGSDRKSTRLNSSHIPLSRMPSSA